MPLQRYQQPQVLLIDDDEDEFFLLNQAFAAYSDQIVIRHLTNSDQLLQSILSVSPLPDLILLDFNLPPENGLEVLTLLKQDSRTNMIPVVIRSGSLENVQVNQCYRAGASSVILKSPDQTNLMRVVRQLCEYWFEAVLLAVNSHSQQ